MAILNAAFLALAGVITLVASLAFGAGGEASAPAIAIGAVAWVVAGSLYLVSFWALAGQTPGMRFVLHRLDSQDGRRIGLRRAVRRLVGLVLAILPLGAGLLSGACSPMTGAAGTTASPAPRCSTRTPPPAPAPRAGAEREARRERGARQRSFETLALLDRRAVATITLNRPESLNTIVPPMPDELRGGGASERSPTPR